MISKNPDAQPYLGAVKVGPKGQIVIPKEVREMFDLAPGDQLVVMAHPKRGVALERHADLFRAADAILSGRGSEVYEQESPENLEVFASNIKKFVKTEESHHDGD